MLLFILSSSVSALAAEDKSESITITTYYPSPYGVYKNLRLYPSKEPAAEGDRKPGTLYYDEDDDNLYIFSKKQDRFIPVTGIRGLDGLLVNAAHTAEDCLASKGTLVDSDSILKLCKFTESRCPSGWRQYKQFFASSAQELSCWASDCQSQTSTVPKELSIFNWKKSGCSVKVEFPDLAFGDNSQLQCREGSCDDSGDECSCNVCVTKFTEIGCY